MNPVEEFIDQQTGAQREIMIYLHELLLSIPDIHCRLRYRIPFYDFKKWICYLNPLKSGGVELVFLQGKVIEDPSGLLQDRGRKMVRGAIFKQLNELPEEQILDWLAQAIALQEP